MGEDEEKFKPEYTVDRLPIVREKTIQIMFRDFFKRLDEGKESFKKFDSEMDEKRNENPNLKNLYNYLERSGFQLTQEELEAFEVGVGITYDILCRQGAINKLEESLQNG